MCGGMHSCVGVCVRACECTCQHTSVCMHCCACMRVYVWVGGFVHVFLYAYVHRCVCMCGVLAFKSVLNAIQYLKTDFCIQLFIILVLRVPTGCDFLLPYAVEHIMCKHYCRKWFFMENLCSTMLVVSTVC